MKDKIITDVISVINNSRKIDVLALVRIRADVDCIIMVLLPITSLTVGTSE